MTRNAKAALLALALIAAIVFATSAQGGEWWGPYPAVYKDNYDGDTVTVVLNAYPDVWISETIRLDGIDAPEIRGKCQTEKTLAKQAKDMVKALMKTNKIVFVRVSTDTTFNRRVGRIRIGDQRLADILREYGLARESKHQLDWCGTPS